MIQKVTAVEYNSMISIIDFISKQLPVYAPDYGLSGLTVDVIPAYPKDLTKFKKPSIIVQKVHTHQSSVGMGGVLGLYEDVDGQYDVYGKTHSMVIQIDVNGETNSQCLLLTSAVMDGVFGSLFNADSRNELPLNDYVIDVNNPTRVGLINVSHDIDINNLSSNENDDYITASRLDCTVIQPIFDTDQGMIDLAKGIKFTQHIKL